METNSLVPLAKWTLDIRHRIFWRLLITLALMLVFAILILRSNAEDARKNHVESQKAVLTLVPRPVPDAQNAATDYRKAFKTYVRFSGKSEDYPSSNLWRESAFFQSPATASFFTANAPYFAGLEAATVQDTCNWNLDYSKGFEAPMDHFSPLREAARMLCARARLRAHIGDHTGAAADLKRVFQISKHVSTDAFLLSGLVQNSIEEIALAALQSILVYDAPGKVDDIAAYHNALPRMDDPTRNLLRMYDCELAMGAETLDRLASQNDNSFSRIVDASIGNTNTVISSEPAELLFSALLYGSERKTHRAVGAEIRKLVQAGGKIPDDASVLPHNQKGPSVIVAMMMPSFSRVQISSFRHNDSLLCMHTALSLLHFRLKKAQDPQSLGELVPDFIPAIPTDFFTHKPLAMLKEERAIEFDMNYSTPPVVRKLPPGTIRVYSFGENGEDDKGRNNWSKERTSDGSKVLGDDSVFFVPPKKSK